MKKVVGYIRVSTERQAKEGVSLDSQKDKIAAWVALNAPGATLVIHADEGLSGTIKDRPALLSALSDVSEGDVLVVYSLSRLARSTKQTIEIADDLQKKGVDLVSLSEKIDTTTAAGKMVFRLLAVLNEFERDQISERVQCAMDHKKSKGEVVGHVPFGYEVSESEGNKKLVKHPNEQFILRRIIRMRKDGMSFRAIAADLCDLGVTNRTGKPFNHVTIKTLCDREGVVRC
jgi:site-specific DNA recombinase